MDQLFVETFHQLPPNTKKMPDVTTKDTFLVETNYRCNSPPIMSRIGGGVPYALLTVISLLSFSLVPLIRSRLPGTFTV